MKGFVIAGTGSGSGKTTLSLGIMAYLAGSGYRVAPFKVGPDFIDPGHHTSLTGVVSRNLDSWMLSRAYNKKNFAMRCMDVDIAVVEGVMGLFDGYSGTSEAGSTAQMAKWLDLPVLLVVDARSMARSAAAIVQGFENFDPDLKFAGVIFSKTGSARHYEYLKEAVADTCRMKCLGHMPRNEKLIMPERHLGLVTSDEHIIAPDTITALVKMIDQNTGIVDMMKSLPEIVFSGWDDREETGIENISSAGIRIAVARDKAFCFYYQENIEALEEEGARIITFSPMNDKELPQNIHGIYLGGGYPELFAKNLSQNTYMLNEIREKSIKGLPVYGECGGFMYLCTNIIDMDGSRSFPMAGCFPFTAAMSGKMKALGYREITLARDTIIGNKGDILRGHEFHYSALHNYSATGQLNCKDPVNGVFDDIYNMTKRDGQEADVKGFQCRNTLGSYVHVHFGSMPEAAKAFVRACRAFKEISS